MSDIKENQFFELSESSLLSDTFELIKIINKKFKDLQRRVIQKFKLSIPQYCIIRNIGTFGSFQLKDLAIKCHLSRPTITGVIDTLEKKKLVIREKNPEDRRSLLINLTQKGYKLFKSLPLHKSLFKNCCSALQSKEILQINTLLVKLLIQFE